MKPGSPRAGDELSQLLSEYDPATPDHLAARTLGRLLQREGDPRRRRELLKAFSARVEELKNGLGCTLSAVYVGEHAVVLPTTSAQGGHSRLASAAGVKSGESVVREIDRGEVPVGVGYTFTADAPGEPGD
ncbi:MAG: hypothetical protein OXG13_02910 [Gemmatimonadaceae bacterium]|nr:hypothetical protein [Gemmatimonadaceae bacterium]